MTYLAHHGIKGQKWGVRRGPPYPIETGMKKGTVVASVSPYENSKTYINRKFGGKEVPVYTFNPDDKDDSDIYRGPFAYYKLSTGKSFVYEHQYTVTKDLKMPTKKERVDAFIETFNNTPASAKELSEIQKWMAQYSVGSEESRSVDLNNLKTKEDYSAAYEIFGHSMEYVFAYTTTRNYLDFMSQRYDAMVDDNNQGIYNGAHDPVVIFKANEALKKLSSRKLTPTEIVEAYKNVAKKMSAEGKHVLL